MQQGAPSAGGARSLAAVALAMALTSAGCDGEVVGEAGRLGFAYSTADGRIDATTPLAVGSRANVVLRSDPGLAFGAIVSAASLDPDTLRVLVIEPNVVVVEALAPGEAELDVTVMIDDDGRRVRDTLVVESREVEQVSIARACATEDGGPVLSGSRIALPFAMSDRDGTALTGWGFYPIDVAPAGALEVDHQVVSTTMLPLVTTGYVGSVELSSALATEPLELEVVAEGEIDSAFLEGGEGANDIPLGDARDVRIVPLVRDEPVCQGEPARDVEVLTPEVCAITPASDRDEIDRPSTLQVAGLAQGECVIAVRYPRAAGGEGLEVTFTLNVS